MRLLYRMQRAATSHAVDDNSHPLLQVREIHKRAVVLVAADKGLCGALNSNLFHLADKFDASSTVFITAGRKATQYVTQSGRQLAAEFSYWDRPRFPEAKAIATCARDLFVKREVDQVQIVATRFVNTLIQQPVCLEFLPVGEITGLNIGKSEIAEETTASAADFLFEPGPEAVLDYLLSHYVNICMYQVLLDAKASEHSARMVSMKAATENADGLIKELTLQYNKLRQENITSELLDIAGGQA
jgi:F-type H+-transporting ATPase subunit gamma